MLFWGFLEIFEIFSWDKEKITGIPGRNGHTSLSVDNRIDR